MSKKNNRAAVRKGCPGSEEGMALLLVLCLFALLIAIGAAVFFAASSASRTSLQETNSLQAALSARSASEVLLKQLEQKPSQLGETFDAVSPGNSIPISTELPDKMGTVEGTFSRQKENYGILTMTVKVRASEYTLRAALSSGPAEDGSTVWIFENYLPEGVK